MADQLNFSSSTPVTELSSRTDVASALPRAKRRILAAGIDWTIVGTLSLLVVLGLGLRMHHLGAIGFAEDEMNKLNAIRSYERGDITANAEHPMLMKAMMYASVYGLHALLGPGRVSDETAVRLPNAIFGALTVIPLFLLTTALFDRWTGLLAAGFWAVGINAITINRVGKEDTLLVFFMLLAFYFYMVAKKTSPHDQASRRRNYILSACSFGLMLASKYFPHYFGLNALYHHKYHVRQAHPGEPSGRTPKIFYLLMPVAFLIANPAVLLPQVWSYLSAYMGEQLLVHTGYYFGGELYKNMMSGTPFWGTPIYFYVLFMTIKIPLAILIAFVVGLVVAFRNWRAPGHGFVLLMFILWIVPYSLVGAKWLRYTLSLMPFVYMLAAIGVTTIAMWIQKSISKNERASLLTNTALVLIFLGLPALAAYASGPHYALYTNALGAGRAGFFFPHDEFYDDGLREAIRFVCDTAPHNAIIAHETPAVTDYYLERFNRNDLHSKAISSPDFDPQKLSGPVYFVVQSGRIYFENRDKLDYVRKNFAKVHDVKVNGLIAAEVFESQDDGRLTIDD